MLVFGASDPCIHSVRRAVGVGLVMAQTAYADGAGPSGASGSAPVNDDDIGGDSGNNTDSSDEEGKGPVREWTEEEKAEHRAVDVLRSSAAVDPMAAYDVDVADEADALQHFLEAATAKLSSE